MAQDNRFDGLGNMASDTFFQNGVGRLSGLTNSSSDQESDTEQNKLAHIVDDIHSSDSNSTSESSSSESASSKTTDSNTSSASSSSEDGSESSSSDKATDSSDKEPDESNASKDQNSNDSTISPSASSKSSSASSDDTESNQNNSSQNSDDSSAISPKAILHDPNIRSELQNNEPTSDSGDTYQSINDDSSSSSDISDQTSNSPDITDEDQSGKTPFERKQVQQEQSTSSDSENDSSSVSASDTDSGNSSENISSNSSSLGNTSDTTANDASSANNDTNIGNPSDVAVNPITQRNLKKHAIPENGMQDFKTSDNQLANMAQSHGAFINVLRVAHKKYGKMPDKDFAKLIAYSNATFKNCQEAIIADRQHIDYRLRQINRDLTDTKHKASNGSKIIQEWKDEGLFSNVSKDMALLDRVVRDPRFQHFVKHLSNGELHQPEQLQEEGEKAGAEVNQNKDANGQQNQ